MRAAADVAIRAGIAVVVLLIALIGGRIVPSFTRNWLVRENPGRLPVPFGRFDTLVVAIGAVALAAWVVRPDSRITGAALALAGLLHLVRLARWAGDRTARERLLLILHVGYFFVPLGFLLNAAAAFAYVPASAGVHAWMVGAAGIMTLAVMSRATLGHTGQQLTASWRHAGDLCRDHRRGAGAHLRGARTRLQRSAAACRRLFMGDRLHRIRDRVRTVARGSRSTHEAESRCLTARPAAASVRCRHFGQAGPDYPFDGGNPGA